MVDLSFSIYDLEYFLLIFVRVSCFVYIAPYFGMNDTPARIRIGISFFTAWLLYETLTPADAVVVDTVMEYAVIVMKEAIAGLLIGFGANICMAVVNFAGSIADMETGLSMATLLDPATKETTSITRCLVSVFFYADADRFRNVQVSFRSTGRQLYTDPGERGGVSRGQSVTIHDRIYE